MDQVWLVVAGICSGVVAGMGMGGGTLLIPILTIFFKTEQKQAQGINLFAFLISGAIMLFVHIKNKLINFKMGLPIMLFGVGFSVLGSMLALNTKSQTLSVMFAIFLLCVGAYQAVSAIVIMIKQKQKK